MILLNDIDASKAGSASVEVGAAESRCYPKEHIIINQCCFAADANRSITMKVDGTADRGRSHSRSILVGEIALEPCALRLIS